MAKAFYVTTPIYYVNDQPHIGHAYTTVAADVLARHNRLRGRDVFFLTGTDEHGQKIAEAAAKRNISPKELADQMSQNFRELWGKLNVSPDAFMRTTDSGHIKIVQDVLADLWKRGEIEKRSYSGWYCTPDERFWTEKDLIDGNCPDCGRKVERIEEENYFFLMSRYAERLARHIEEHPRFILPESRRNEVLGFLRSQPLGDLCISRPVKRMSWGIPLPFDPEFVTYVWFDALLNYYSAPQYLAGKNIWPATHQLIGKDILTTHSVYWATMLLAMGEELPENIFAHGWWTINGRKMSKSLGNVVSPGDVAEKYGADAFRYFLMREVPFGLDGDYSEDALIKRINVDLANDLGNLASRVHKLIMNYCEGKVPAPEVGTYHNDLEKYISCEEGEFAEKTNLELPIKVAAQIEAVQFHRALEEIWKLVTYTNRYIDMNAPWQLAKDPAQNGRLGTVLYHSAEALRLVSLYLIPFMPTTMRKLRSAFGQWDNIFPDKDFVWGALKPGTELSPLEQLFPRIGKPKEAAPANVVLAKCQNINYHENTDILVKAKDSTHLQFTKVDNIKVNLEIVYNLSDVHKRLNEQNNKEKKVTEPEKTPETAAIAPAAALVSDAAATPVASELIGIDEFAKVELRTAKILQAERVEKSKKLLRLQVDCGDQRQIVAGIGGSYAPEDLVGKTVIIVANLKPVKLMGNESNGMVLAATDEDGKPVVLTTLAEVRAGLRIK